MRNNLDEIQNSSKDEIHSDHKHHNHHKHEHENDPFTNPSRFFIWRYALRNYLRRRIYYEKLMKQFNLQGSESILDFGSGVGSLARKVAPRLQKDGKLICLDVSPKLLEYTKGKLKKYTNVDYVLGNISNLSLPDKNLDIIVSTWVLHHLEKEELDNTVDKFGSLLKENGRIFIIEFPEEYEHARHFHHLIKLTDILELFKKQGFSEKVLFSKEGGILYEFKKD